MRHRLFSHLPFHFIILTVLVGCFQETSSPSPEEVTVLLTTLLHDKSFEVRRTAAESLGKIGDRTAASVILPAIKDPVPEVRAAAAQALGRLSSDSTEGVVDALILALEDPDDSVKEAAALAVSEIEPPSERLGPVVHKVYANEGSVRKAAIRALLQVDARPWLSALSPAVHDSNMEVRQGVVAVLGESGGPFAEAEIQKRLIEDASPAVRSEAAYHLRRMDGVNAKEALVRASERDPDAGVRRWAEEGLRSLRASD